MDFKIKSLESNKLWELCEPPKAKKAWYNKWIFKIREVDGSNLCKESLVLNRLQNKFNINYIDVFTLEVKLTMVWLVLSIFLIGNLEL